MNVAIIPARGGSKRIPGKNVKAFCGKPMIAWSIEAAHASACFDRVIVSTDDEVIAGVALAHGAEVPFVRPAALADDHAGTMPVIRHAIEWLQQMGSAPQMVCCLYATAPFVSAADLRRGRDLLAHGDCDYAFTVTSYPFPIQRAVRINDHGRVEMFDCGAFHLRSQDFKEAYHDAGQFYWGWAQAWVEGRVVFGPGSVPVRLPRHQVQDIDTPEDWVRAEWLFKAMRAAHE